MIDACDLRLALAKDGGALRTKLDCYRADGFEIVLSMPACFPENDNPVLSKGLDDLKALASLCDAVVFGGPSKRFRGLHLDDKAVTSDEFISLAFRQLTALVEKS